MLRAVQLHEGRKNAAGGGATQPPSFGGLRQVWRPVGLPSASNTEKPRQSLELNRRFSLLIDRLSEVLL
jgi:hypothetical protein